jgi:transcriptional regulator with XRE-family HTH domain
MEAKDKPLKTDKIFQDPRWLRYLELHRKYLYISSGQFDFRTTELAKALGINRRTIQRWMKGTGSPKEKHIKVLESFLKSRGVSL